MSEDSGILNYNKIENKILLKCRDHGEKIIHIHDYLNSISQILDNNTAQKEYKCIKHYASFELYCKTCEISE